MANEQPTTMEEIVADLKDTAERIGESLGPDEDWVPVVCLYGDKPAIIAIPFLGDPEAKGVIASKIIPAIITQGKPNFVALVMLGWAKMYDTKTIEGAAEQARDEAKFEQGDIANRPGKTEILLAYIHGKDGREHQLMAHVHRHPTLSPTLQWFIDHDHNDGKAEGRFPDALRAGMEAAWKKK